MRVRMPFQGRYERFRKLQREKMGEQITDRAPCDEMEKGDGLAMLIAALVLTAVTAVQRFVSVWRQASAPRPEPEARWWTSRRAARTILAPRAGGGPARGRPG